MGITTVNQIEYSNNNQAVNFCTIVLNKELFFPGETVTGEVWIISPNNIFISNVIVRLVVDEEWRFAESSDSIFADCKPIVLFERGLIEENNCQNNKLMLNLKPLVKYPFKFSIELPKNLHPSFEYPFPNRNSSIRYKVTATLLGPIQYPIGKSHLIIKSRPLVLSEPLNYSSCINVHTWGLMENGTTIMSVAFPTNNFRYKDLIPVKVTINNSRGELDTKYIKVEISRDIAYFSQSGVQRYAFSKTITKQEFPFVCARHTKNTIELPIQLIDDEENSYYWNTPYTSLKEKRGLFIGSIESSMIHCKYNMKLTCYFSSMVGYDNRPRIVAPLSLTYQLNDEFQLELKENEQMKEALFESKIEYENIKENQKNCLIDDNNNNEVSNEKNAFNLFDNDIEENKPMQMSVINDVYQVNKIINNNYYNQNQNQGIYQQPIQNNVILKPKDEKPADFVDINAL